MAQLVVSAAGAAVGFALGGPTGARIGWAVGSILGSSLGPSQKVKGPRLGDLSAPKLEYGNAIPLVRGRYRVAGTPIWASAKREIATTTEQGKGGPSVSSTTYTYEQDVLYLISDNPGEHLKGVSRIWSNGELVWSALPESDDTSRLASRDTELWTALRTYSGADGQLPDAVYVPDAGVDLAPAYTGRLTIMIEGLQLGNSGQIPLLEFETATIAIPGPEVILLLNFEGSSLTCEASGEVFNNNGTSFNSTGAFGDSLEVGDYGGGGNTYNNINSNATTQWDLGHAGDFDIELWVRFNERPDNGRPNVLLRIAEDDSSTSGKNEYAISMSSFDSSGDQFRFSAYYPDSNTTTNSTSLLSFPWTADWIHLRFVRQSSVHRLWVTSGGIQKNTGNGIAYTDTYRRAASNKLCFIGNTSNYSALTDALDGAIDAVRIVKGVVYGNDYTVGFAVPTSAPSLAIGLEQYDYDALDLEDEVQMLCQRAGLQASDVDATALAGTTLEGYAVTQVTPVRSVLEMMAGAFYFECVESDKLYFRLRGGASAATLAWDDIGAAEGGDPPADRLGLNRGNELEVPARVALSYINIDDDYQSGSVYADRRTGSGTETQTAQLAIAITPAQAQGIADTMVQDQAVAATTLGPTLPYSIEPELEPTDVATWTDDQGTTYRARIVRETLDGGVRKLDCVLDDANVLAATGSTETGYTPTITVAEQALTRWTLLDMPILRDADDGAGDYAALKSNGGKWPGASLLSSTDGTTYGQVGQVTSSAVFGEVTVALTDWAGGNVWDTGGSVTVDVGLGTLASSTRDNILASNDNAMLVGNEVIRFATATLVSTGVYKLTILLRGQRGTEWAMTGHGTGETATLLATAGLLRVAYSADRVGVAQLYKGVTAGRPVAGVRGVSFTSSGVGLKPFAPVDIRAARSTDGALALSWKRRTRLATRFAGSLGIFVPLGETAEAYTVRLYSDSLYSGLLRTLSATSESVSYTLAQQVADGFILRPTLYVQVEQEGAVTGYTASAALSVPSYDGPVWETTAGPGLAGEFDGAAVALDGGQLNGIWASRILTSADDGETWAVAYQVSGESVGGESVGYGYGARILDAALPALRLRLLFNSAASLYSGFTSADNTTAPAVVDPCPVVSGVNIVPFAAAADTAGSRLVVVGIEVTASLSGVPRLFASTDGATWTAEGDMTQDGADPNDLGGAWVGSWSHATFAPLFPVNADARLQLFGSRWFLSAQQGIYYTDDATLLANWFRCPTGLGETITEPYPSLFHPVQRGSYLVAARRYDTTGDCIAYSSDSGATWTQVRPTALGSNQITQLYAHDGYVIAETATGLIRATDPSSTWTAHTRTGRTALQDLPRSIGANLVATVVSADGLKRVISYSADGIDWALSTMPD